MERRGGSVAYLNKEKRDTCVMYSCSSTVVSRGGGIVAGLRVGRLGIRARGLVIKFISRLCVRAHHPITVSYRGLSDNTLYAYFFSVEGGR